MPARYVPHRWLSIYDVAVDTIRLYDAYRIFYYGFLTGEDKTLYGEEIEDLMKENGVSAESRRQIRKIWDRMSSKLKTCTVDGKDRKKRIVQRLFYERKKTELQLHLYVSALEELKTYVCVFQTADTMVFQLHDRQFEVFKNFLTNFLKPEFIARKSAKELQMLDLSKDEGKFLRKEDIFVGSGTQKLIRQLPKHDTVVQEFRTQALTAFSTCAAYMQKKLPLNSPVLKSLSCIDPVLVGTTQGSKGLSRLASTYLGHVLSTDEKDNVDREIKLLQVDSSIPAYVPNPEKVGQTVVNWWAHVFESGRYPCLSKVIAAALSIFHGPRVESSFNVMGDVVNAKSNRMNTDTYSATQTIKYTLKKKDQTAIEYFQRNDPLYDPIRKDVCFSMRAAAKRYKTKKSENALRKTEKREQLNIGDKPIQSKAAARKETIRRERHAKLQVIKRVDMTEKIVLREIERNSEKQEKRKLMDACEQGPNPKRAKMDNTEVGNHTAQAEKRKKRLQALHTLSAKVKKRAAY